MAKVWQVKDWGPRFARHVGRRGAFLIFLALVDFSTALTLLTLNNNPDVTASVLRNYRGFTNVMPFQWWGVIWAVIGVIALFSAFTKSADRVAFSLCSALKAGWAFGFFTSWQFYGAERGWSNAVIYGVFAAIVLLVSGWKENHEREVF